MLPHSKDALREVLAHVGTIGVVAILKDMRYFVNKLTENLVNAETEREVILLQGQIRAIMDLVDRYTRPQ
jgi:hypothetical protein